MYSTPLGLARLTPLTLSLLTVQANILVNETQALLALLLFLTLFLLLALLAVCAEAHRLLVYIHSEGKKTEFTHT
ncbi:hypothetical protein DFS34DRAFT_630280 [Phlyctochytrium arcticum]|nr:hypothetical protein DFS34DRAFT_630280 [Phlyctochytrium arcticum]